MTIDRSDPLPIHQFPSLIAKVAELQKLEAKATPGTWTVENAIGYEHIWRFIKCDPPKGRPDDTYIAGTLGRRKDNRVVALSGLTVIEEAENDANLIAALRNAAPDMLDVLSLVRAGDAERLEYAVRYLETTNCPAQCIEAVSRMLELARLMEETK